MLYIDGNGNLFQEKIEGIELTEINIEAPTEGLESYIGEIWIDHTIDCTIDDRERAFWYKYENGQLVKHDWKKRFEDGEFTLEDFRAKVLGYAKKTYKRLAQTTDAIFTMYAKRNSLGILEEGDEETYTKALDDYKSFTVDYRRIRDAAKSASTIEELVDLLPK